MSDPVVEELSARGVDERIEELVALLADAIGGGASVGFVDPLAPGELEAYWREIALEVEDGMRSLWVALDAGHVVGSVQLAPSGKTNQRHRADIQKLMVLSPARGRGIGAALMRVAEQRALALGRWLLTLDTREASDADRLYRRWGWTSIGAIPEYAMDPDRSLASCVFYYKKLAP